MRGHWLPLGLVVLVTMLPGCAQFLDVVGRPTVKAVRPKITGINLQGVDVAFEMDVDNPYVVPLKSPALHYGLDIEGSEFITAKDAVTVDLPASGTGTVTLPVSLTYSKLRETYKKLADAKQFAYRLHGSLGVAAMGRTFELPLSHSGTLPVLRPPKFSNVKLRFAGTAFTVDADVQNPNLFALGLKNLGYGLKLGDVVVGDLVASTLDSVAPGGSGHVTLKGKLSAASALMRLTGGGRLGAPNLAPVGVIETPYGAVKLK